MKLFFIVFTLSTCCALALAASTDKQAVKSSLLGIDYFATTVIVGRRGDHHFTIRLSRGPLRKHEHIFRNKKGKVVPAEKIILEGKEDETIGPISMDGNFSPIGTDYGIPWWEFYAFDVMVDGKEWDIPKNLWADLYDPSIMPWVVLTTDGKRLAMGMEGSDGAGAYAVIWYLHADGHSSRKIFFGDDIYYVSHKKHPTPSTRPNSNKAIPKAK